MMQNVVKAVTIGTVSENHLTEEISAFAFGGWVGNSENDRAAESISGFAIYEGAMTV